MKNFYRAARIALRLRATLVGIIITSLLVGVLWGANIGVVYPFVEVIFQRDSLHEWVDGRIDEAKNTSAALRTSIARYQQQLGQHRLEGKDRAQAESNLLFDWQQLMAEQKALARFQRMSPYIKQYCPADPFQTMVWIVTALLIGTSLKCAFIVANMMLVSRLIQLTILTLRKQFYRRALSWDLALFGKQHNSELLSRFTNDVGMLGGSLSTLFGKATREPLKMIACLIGAALISWQLLVVSLLVSPPSLFLMRRLAQSIRRANRRAMEETANLFERISETFHGIQTVKAFTMEPYERNRFHHSAKELYRKAMKIVFYNSLTKPITELLGIGVIALALVVGAYLVVNRETHLFGFRMCERPLSLGSLLLFYSLLAGVSDPARKMTEIFASIQSGFAAAERVYAMLDREPLITDPASPKAVAQPHQRIVFDHVSFSYEEQQLVLKDIDFEIKYGETLAIVGPNGCGKSTLINLVTRFYDPVEGSVRMDDVALTEMRLRDLRRRIGVVTQQTHLFHETILNNIRYGSPRASEEQVVDAARKAHAHRFITEELSDGYETIAGQGGNRLSGGQRQRIALARAILRDPEILILDEATSQIDLESEQLIHHALEEFANGRTAIIITHRLSTLALADRILVMDAGRMVDLGTHEQLLARCPLYRRLQEIQFKQIA
jgi:ATP-binding cassette subfamily B protein/subfamily B ATP-binding cassette protein MsbA